MSKVTPKLGEVQETLLIPLYGRALDAQSRHSILNDGWARALVERIDYDFDRFCGASLPGSVVRTAIFDAWVRRFLDQYPTSTVIDIGTGLNTRFERVDNGCVRWFDLDLPDSIALRRQLFDDDYRRTMVSSSVLDSSWYDQIADAQGPYLFVAEAVFVYFAAAQVHSAVAQLAQRFPDSLIAFDTAGPTMIEHQDRNGAMKTIDARMQWVCDDPRSLEPFGLQMLDSRTFANPQPEVAKSLPARYRFGMPLLARVVPSLLNSYRFNLYRLGSGLSPT